MDELSPSELTSEIAHQMVPKGFTDPGYLAMFEPDIETELQRVAGAQRLGIEKPILRLQRHRFSDHLIWDDDICRSKELAGLVFAVTIESIGQLLTDNYPAVRKIYFSHAKPTGWSDWCLANIADANLTFH